MEILIVVVPAAVVAAFWFFARTIKTRRRAGRHYEFRHPLPGAYGGGGVVGNTAADGGPGTSAVDGEPQSH
ncbi:hypothetical protein [Rhodococcus sovatensis]|uniref:Secreted protein n=1 Tax=Rhodococcus sovatensis TaxID=1805840 RepID=A0ABZ2PK82_9NOCA